jgi:hypothetical protein
VAEGLFRMAGRLLKGGGWLILYGPYTVNGEQISPRNAAFDAALRAQNPEWGVRDVADIAALAAANGLRLCETIAMPANNLTLVVAGGQDG